MFTAMFILRSRCERPFFHTDWADELGVQALTLITPLEEYKGTEGFHLLYGRAPHQHERLGDGRDESTEDASLDDVAAAGRPEEEEDGGRANGRGAGGMEEARYEYKKGTGLVFGSHFRHSTEPGRPHPDDGVHAYLCFTFGTDDPTHWPMIGSAIGGQSRVCRSTSGELELTRLGRELGQDGGS